MSGRLKIPERLYHIPWADCGRGWSGCDCYGLVRLAAREIFGQELPTLDENYASVKDRETLEQLIFKHSGKFKRVQEPQPGDLVLFRIIGFNSHIGLVLEPDRFMHMWKGAGVGIERFMGPKWVHRIEGFYRHAA